MGRSQELSEFKRGTVIGCNKPSHEISSPLNIPQSVVSGIIAKWKQLGTTATKHDLMNRLQVTWSEISINTPAQFRLL